LPKSLLRTDIAVYVVIALLTASAWWISAQGWFSSWSRTGYWLGVTGGVLMTLLFSYPLRKRWRLTYGWGATRYWFIAHMSLGILGPWFILLHSTFRIGSTNAAVALFSMVIVALSGVVGRFLYVRLHADLRGEKASLASLRELMRQQQLVSGVELGQFPQALKALNEFESAVLMQVNEGRRLGLWRLFVIPMQRRRVEHRCMADVKKVLDRMQRENQLTSVRSRVLYQQLTAQVQAYTLILQRLAQFQPFEKLFSLWHVAHVPFVWIMLLCAIFHVVAVHAY